MTEEKIQELLNSLRELRYTCNVLGKTEHFYIISSENFAIVENVVRQFMLDNHDSEKGELQGKVYAYEKIIANSNFAPMLNLEKENHPALRDPIIFKIRQQLLDEKELAYADFDAYKEDVLGVEADELPYDDFKSGLERAIDIINRS